MTRTVASPSRTRLPSMIRVRQRLHAQRVSDLSAAVAREMEKCTLSSMIKKGDRVAITAGSRGIARIDEVLWHVARQIERAGGKPFLFPAMGSHGGATPEGQLALLKSLGISEETMQAPVRATMEVERVGETEEGLPVFVDRYAAGADGIIVVNRIKQHTDFSGPIESGLSKMTAIGMGKRHGAEAIHNLGLHGLHDHIPRVAAVTLNKVCILMGLALVENGYHQLASVIGLGPEEMQSEEQRLLKAVRRHASKIPFSPIDVLIIDHIGKDISGTGIDTKVIGRLREPPHPELRYPVVRVAVSLDLTEASHGNGVGVGLTEFTTQKLVDKIDWEVTRTNIVTAQAFERTKVPFVFPTAEEAVRAAVEAVRVRPPENLRMLRIKDTLHLDEMEISPALREEAGSNPRIEILGPANQMRFDD